MSTHVQPGALACAVIAVALGVQALAHAQPLNRNFERDAPSVGDVVPDAVVYDRDGIERRLRDLVVGHPTVLILGCLT